MKKGIALCVLFLLSALCVGCGKQSEDDVTVLRVANWEEYIDEGGWSEDETIELADGTIVLADEFSPDPCRFWDSETNEKLDKDRFRRDMGGVEDAYHEMMKRVFGA